MGSWPMTSDDVSGTFSEDNFNLIDMLAYANLHGATPLFGFGVGQDEHNSSLNVIDVSWLLREYLLVKLVNDFFTQFINDNYVSHFSSVWPGRYCF